MKNDGRRDVLFNLTLKVTTTIVKNKYSIIPTTIINEVLENVFVKDSIIVESYGKNILFKFHTRLTMNRENLINVPLINSIGDIKNFILGAILVI